MLRRVFIAHAEHFLGVHETGPNRGPEVSRWLRRAGAPSGSPWCAAFVYSMLRNSGYAKTFRNAASCAGLITHATDEGRVKLKPQAGDVVVFDWRDGGNTADHCGIVKRVIRFGPVVTLTTIEGNTPGVGGKPDGVYRRRRVIARARLTVLRFWDS